MNVSLGRSPDMRGTRTLRLDHRHGERAGSLIWVTESGRSDNASAFIAEVRRADDWGLRSDLMPLLDAAAIASGKANPYRT